MPKIFDNVLIRLFIYLLLAAYLVWEIYWYNQVGLTFIRWHTHLAFPVYFFGLIFYILNLLKVNNKVNHILFSVFLTVMIVELFVLISGIGKTYSEKKYGYFLMSGKNGSYNTYYWIDEPFSFKKLVTDEFHYTRRNNSLGYSDFEWNKKKESKVTRIICLGDSFTEGDGAHEDSNYVSFLRKTIKENNLKAEVFNAGKCGSDPYFNFKNYKDRLVYFKPDIIVQTLSTQDIYSDIAWRGGLERFQSKNRLAFLETSKYTKLVYGISFFSRPIFFLFNITFNEQKLFVTRKEKNSIKSNLKLLFDKYKNLCNENNCKLIISFLPQKNEITEGYDDFFNDIIKSLSQNHKTIDLRVHYLNQATTDYYNEYYWIKDGHHNALGYKMMAEGIFKGINQYLLESKEIK